MKTFLHALRGVILLAAAFTAGCSSSGSSAKPPSSSSSTKPACEGGTLGIQAAPFSRAIRRKLALPDDFQGALVAEVLPGSPAAAAGIRPDDVVEEIGGVRIGSDCDVDTAGYGRTCEPVSLVVRRGGAAIRATLVPIEADSFLERSCEEGSTTGCFRQAWNLWSRNRGGDRERAHDIYQAACRAGSAPACAYEGLHLIDRPDLASDAVPVLQRACDLGSGAGCAHLAFLYATGKIVRRDDHRATPLYVRACDLGDAKGCYNAGLMADEGRGVKRDLAHAVARYSEACGMGSSTACTNLGFHYEHGTGLPKDAARAFALYERGCRGTACQPSNLGGCLNTGRAYRDAIGVEKNAARSAEIFRDACGRKPDPDDLHADENRSRACSLLGGLYLAGDGVEKDPAKGRELSELGCERGDSFGCFNAAVVATDPAKAASFLARACEAGDGEGCRDLGVAYEKGNGVVRDRKKAGELIRKACELGFQEACPKKKR